MSIVCRSHSLPVRRSGPATDVAIVLIMHMLFVSSEALSQTAPVNVASVVQRELHIGHRVVGTVVPIRSSTVGTAVDGRVEEFLMDTGDAVKADQPLARLRTGTLEIELRAAQAELLLRQEELNELQNGSRPEEITEAKARMLAADAIHKNALTRLKRLEELFQRQAINQTELDDAAEQAEAASQSLQALQAAFQQVEVGPRAEQIAQAQATVALQEARVQLIEDRIRKFTIYAPYDGFVTAELTEVGEWVSQADPIAKVIALDQVEVLCNVPADQAVRLQKGRDVHVEFSELPNDLFTGRIKQIVPIADNRTRTFPVTIQLSNKTVDGRPLLLAGMLARALLPTGTRTAMPLVPKDALVLNGRRRYVFVVSQDRQKPSSGTVKSVPVTLGVADGEWIQVDGDLKSGDLVVVRGNERLKDGQEVVFQMSEASDSVVVD